MARVIPFIRQTAPAPSLFATSLDRLKKARHDAANKANVAALAHKPANYRMWMRVVEQCDAAIFGESVA